MKVDLTTSKGYDIASALRGPDDEMLSSLKWVFTAALRNMVGIDPDKCFAGVVRNKPLTDGEAVRVIETLIWAQNDATSRDKQMANHYLNHVVMAAAALGYGNLATLADECRQAVYGGGIPLMADIQRLAGDGYNKRGLWASFHMW